jgi:ligand-binding SRPBCC domain-containing protein
MPTFTLDTEMRAPIERCFDLARNVDLHTRSSHVPERAIAGKTSGLLELGDEVTWEARHFCRRQRLTARIVAMEYPSSFAAEMIKGPFASHTHRFTFREGSEGTTMMHEVFQFQSPLGFVGGIADALVLTWYLKRFTLRRDAFLKEQAEMANVVTAT